MGYEELHHTADVALRCWGPDLSELFAAAARGLAALLGPAAAEGEPLDVALSAPDAETLLVDWLTELIYQAERSDGTFARVEVTVSPQLELRAQVWPAALAERRGVVKAATYHGLTVESGPDGLSATIILDT